MLPPHQAASTQASLLTIAALALGAAWLPGCRCDSAPDEPAAALSTEEQSTPGEQTELSYQSRLPLLDIAARCDLFHQGLVLDLGSDAIENARSFRLDHPDPLVHVQHQGRSYARLTSMQTRFLIWLPAAIEQVEVSAQVHGGTSERMAIYVDDQRLGATSLHEGKSEVVRIRSPQKTITAGLHELVVSISRRHGRDPGADVSWVRLGPVSSTLSDTPPSRSEVFSEMSTGGQQQPAVILRHGGLVSCPVWVPAGATFETSLGVWGTGDAVANIQVRTDGGNTTSLRQVRLEPDAEHAGWADLKLDLSSYAGRAVELQLSAERVAEGSRLGFSSPTIVGPEQKGPPHTLARQVIVLMLSGLAKRQEAPSATDNGLPVIGALARTAETFSDYRTPTTSVTATVASLLTGQQPWQHGLDGEDHVLSPTVTGLAETFQGMGGRSAFFTGVPLSFEGFGFERGFEKFSSLSPVEDRAATAPIDEAEAWLTHHQADDRPRLVFIHLRGAHPPFDIDRDAARVLPPPEYGGDLDARRAAIQLSEIRGRPRSRQRMPEEDWTRFLALQKAALLKQDARISQFLAWLARTGQSEHTLLVVMGDVSAGERPTIPFSLDADVTEDVLQTLLLMRHPDGRGAGTSSHLPFTTVDVTATIAGYLGINLPGIWAQALDLGVEARRSQAEMRLQIAYRRTHYSTRQGPYLLRGTDGRPPSLCQLPLDPGCIEDRAQTQAIATRALWTGTWLELSSALSQQSEPVERPEDERLEAALAVWGVPR